MKKILVAFALIFQALGLSAQSFRDSALPTDERVSLLLQELTVEEKVSLLGYRSPSISRLNIPEYNWWNEALHGVARAGVATVFPQAIAMAATFNDSLVNRIADAISSEARAKYNLAVKENRRLQYMGLTFWSPNINIFRDPRWGRGQETYGEDPFLTGTMGAAYIRGLQGSDPRYLKAAACAKHFAVHSGPEADRHSFNAVVSEKDLRETYLYAFHRLVDAGVESVMCAYNRVNGEPCCTSNTLLRRVLREEWKFGGHVVTDCWALQDIYDGHKVMNDAPTVAAAAIKAGVNMDCSNLLQDNVIKALSQRLITEADIDIALTPALRTQFKLGAFDDPSLVPYSKIGVEAIHHSSHVALSRLAARQSMVLLKNDRNILPLDRRQYATMLIAGTNATSADALLGNYHGLSRELVTFAEGIAAAAGPAVGVQYDMGSDYTDTVRFGGIWVSQNSDVTIAVIGLTPVLEGEHGDAFLAPHGGDKTDLELPPAHVAYMKALRKSHKQPIIAVITAGSATNIAAIEPYADAIIYAWYPGEQGGAALADLIFGDASPSGRLPITFYKSLSNLPAYNNYDMRGRTYRYYEGDVQYPFGFGLSYSTFDYKSLRPVAPKLSAGDTLHVELQVANTGKMNSDEVVQAYVSYPGTPGLKELKAFKRIHLKSGNSRLVRLAIPANELRKWNPDKNKWELTKGQYKLVIGSHSRDEKVVYTFRV
jgi:beta-glucosidase